MATNIFTVRPGHALAVRDTSVTPLTLEFDDWGGFDVRRCIVQGVSVGAQTNHQFLNTLRKFIYVYIFGDKMHGISISGIAFTGKCEGCPSANDRVDGISEVIRYYKQKRLSTTGEPVGITLGAAAMSGFLTGAKFDIIDPRAQLGTFSLIFAGIPYDDEQPENEAPAGAAAPVADVEAAGGADTAVTSTGPLTSGSSLSNTLASLSNIANQINVPVP
jgi:hypothetical protein